MYGIHDMLNRLPIYDIFTFENASSFLASFDDKYVLRLEVPGYTEESIKVETKESIKLETKSTKLVVSGSVEGDGLFVPAKSNFSNTVSLPQDSNIDGITAELKLGILIVTIPRIKYKEVGAKSVPVKQLK
jgi:HSP20 family molecular chaperone IbpA